MQFQFYESIKTWALKFHINHNALNNLLAILHEFGMNFLPRDSRSLLKTPKNVAIVPIGNGQYWYNGIKNCLQHEIAKLDQIINQVSLTFNIDGFSTSNSSKYQFWPILCSMNMETRATIRPMIISIYYGDTKPPVEEFLFPFVEELNNLIKNGLTVDGNQILIKIRCFICDSPARSLIKGR